MKNLEMSDVLIILNSRNSINWYITMVDLKILKLDEKVHAVLIVEGSAALP